MRSLLAAAAGCALVAAAAPTTVEPPGWWAGHSINPVRVMLTGRDLSGPVTADNAALRPRRLVISSDRRYAFFDLVVGAGAKPGRYALRVSDETVPFEIYRPLRDTGRFSGLSQDDVLYLIVPDRFANGDPANDGVVDRANPRAYHGGDLAGVALRLPYLKELGVTAIWLTPIFDNAGATSYHGYHAADLYRVEEHFGDTEALRELVDRAHALGIKVLLDQVANHVGPEHPWAQSPPTPTWLNGTVASHLSASSEMWTLLDPYGAAGLSRRLLQGWFVNRLPDLNQNDREVERYLIQNSLWWFGRSGIDGARLDTVPYVPKAFWSAWMRAVRRQYPRAEAVGEVYSRDPRVVAHFEDTGMRLFDFPVQEAILKVFLDGGSLTAIPAALAADAVYARPARLVTFFGSHDVRRFRETGSHDALKNAFLLLLTTRGTPLIYYGDEIGMQGGGDPDNRRDFPGGWPGDARNAFEAAGRTPREQELFVHVQKLLRLRQQQPALRRGRLINLHAERTSYVYARALAGAATVVVALGAASRFDAPPDLGLTGAGAVSDALGSGSTLRRTGNSAETSGPGIFILR
jgi:neopullulanase